MTEIQFVAVESPNRNVLGYGNQGRANPTAAAREKYGDQPISLHMSNSDYR
jgi:hypothetical protein